MLDDITLKYTTHVKKFVDYSRHTIINVTGKLNVNCNALCYYENLKALISSSYHFRKDTFSGIKFKSLSGSLPIMQTDLIIRHGFAAYDEPVLLQPKWRVVILFICSNSEGYEGIS